MKHYALIFHSTRPVTPEERNQRTVDIAAWVKQVVAMGITLDPRNFGDTAANFSATASDADSHKASTDSSLATIVFFDSSDRDQAVNIARIHPGPHYGAAVSLREWSSPRETSTNQ
jgi:hypothetical protein